jgi:hypothetical protein
MQSKVEVLNSKYTETHLHDDEIIQWLRHQALRKYQISEDIGDVISTVYGDMINCYLQKRNKS